MTEIGARVAIYRPGAREDGWLGSVVAVSPTDVMVKLDHMSIWGRFVSLPPENVRPATRQDEPA